MRRDILAADLVIAAVAATVTLLITPGVAVAAFIGLLVLCGCAIGAARGVRRERRRSARLRHLARRHPPLRFDPRRPGDRLGSPRPGDRLGPPRPGDRRARR